jgi:hypothetical protein
MFEVKIGVYNDGSSPFIVYDELGENETKRYKCVFIKNPIGFVDKLDGELYRFASRVEEEIIIRNNLNSKLIQHYLMNI